MERVPLENRYIACYSGGACCCNGCMNLILAHQGYRPPTREEYDAWLAGEGDIWLQVRRQLDRLVAEPAAQKEIYRNIQTLIEATR